MKREKARKIVLWAMIASVLVFLFGTFAQAQGYARDGYIRGGFLGNQFMCGYHGYQHTYPIHSEYGCYDSGSGRGQRYNRNQIGGRSRRSSYSINITSSRVVGVAQVAEGAVETIFGFKDNNRERDHEYRLARLERGLPEGQGLVPVATPAVYYPAKQAQPEPQVVQVQVQIHDQRADQAAPPTQAETFSQDPGREYNLYSGPDGGKGTVTVYVFNFKNVFELPAVVIANGREVLHLMPGEDGVFKSRKQQNDFQAKSIIEVHKKGNPFDAGTETYHLGFQKDHNGVYLIDKVAPPKKEVK